MKKLVSLFLALIMLTALVPSVMADEPVKITYGSTQSVANFAEFEIIQELCQKLNIELTVTNYDYDSLLVTEGKMETKIKRQKEMEPELR